MSDKTQTDIFYIRLTFVLLIAVTFFWFTISQGIFVYSQYNPEEAAQRGDLFGAVNALFSAWAFVGVIVAILMQRSELKLQREELIETRKLHALSVDAQQKSEGALNQQVTCQFFVAYLNALAELKNVPDVSTLTIKQRRTNDKLLGIVSELENQASEILGISLPQTTLSQHIRDCLNSYENRLNGLVRRVDSSDSIADSIAMRTNQLLRDFDQTLPNDTIYDFGETFQKLYAVEYPWIGELVNIVAGCDKQDAIDRLQLAVDAVVEIRNTIP